MSNPATSAVGPIHALSSFDDVVDALSVLTRRHGLAFRLGVVADLLNAFYDGDFRSYQQRAGGSDSRFEAFFAEMRDPLGRLGISSSMARQSIRAVGVWRTLPEPVRDSLALGQLVTLTRLGDPSARLQVAAAALRHGWTQAQLEDAVDTVRGGGILDAAALAAIEADGEAQSAGHKPQQERHLGSSQPGRLVTEAEKWSARLDDWGDRWAGVDPTRLRPAQRQRLRAATDRLRTRVEALQAALAKLEAAERD